jgi:predicted small metal-binding protein
MRLDQTTARQITCECGHLVQADSDDEVLGLIEDHLREQHPQVYDQLTREDIASWVEIVE